jgi:hypothetical protein
MPLTLAGDMLRDRGEDLARQALERLQHRRVIG